MDEKILLVDDEAAVLDGYQRLLGREFNLETAVGPDKALARIDGGAAFAVVVSDMRMPGMNGAEFLARVMGRMPNAVRIMLTGNADVDTAINAVNDGNIFRFLTKPCPKEKLAKTLTAALQQYRLLRAEQDLLENTLSGSIEVLVDVLSLVNPEAFSRATRVRRCIRQLAEHLKVDGAWKYEVAGMLSQLGCVTLQTETIEAVYAGLPLPREQQARFDAHPGVARDLLRKIPRMEEIAWMIAQQNNTGRLDNPEVKDQNTSAATRLGAEILRGTLAFDALLATGASRNEAVDKVRSRFRDIDLRVIRALREVDFETGQAQIRNCPIPALVGGMILQEEVRTSAGLLIVAKGQEITLPLLVKLRNFHEAGSIPGEVMVATPGAKHEAVAEETAAPK